MSFIFQLSLTEHDDVTPVTLLHNTAVHLYGASRTLGAVICGYSGIRFFQPQPLRSLLSSVGGTKVVLGLVAMATTVDNLYASMKALVCIVGNNLVALREMERTGGFQVCCFWLVGSVLGLGVGKVGRGRGEGGLPHIWHKST